MHIFASYINSNRRTWPQIFARRVFGALLLTTLIAALAQPPKPPETPAQQTKRYFDGVNKQVLEMAQDFPADKYDFRLRKEMRSFGEVIVHVMSGNVYAAKAGRGEKANWDELDAKNYRTKADIVAALQKSIADCAATLKAHPMADGKSIEPWIGVMQHSSEHYGLLVAYYRANGLVPPASRPKTK
jgi:hypothetical protein